MRMNISSIGLASMILCSCTVEPVIKSVATQAQNETITDVRRGASFQITLPAAAGSGYQWRLVSYEEKNVKLVKKITTAQELNKAGGQISELWFFEVIAMHPARTTLKFELIRDWELIPLKTSIQVFNII